MNDTLNDIKSVLEMFGLNSMIVIQLYIFIITMGQVFFFGRMTNITKDDTVKNIIAYITIVFFSALYTFVKYGFYNIVKTFKLVNIEAIITIFIDYTLCVSFAVVIYVLVGFKLYDRVNALFDKKIGIDKHKKIK